MIPTPATVAISDADFAYLQQVVQQKCGLYLEPRKKDLVFLRLKKRLKISRASDLRDYCDKLMQADGDKELQKLIDEVTTQHTKFFRENTQLKYLQQQILPKIQQQGRARAEKKIRIWSAGCSSGEEPYTLAMILLETLGAEWDIRILASDICQRALQTDSQGEYSVKDTADIAPNLLKKYFAVVGDGDQTFLRVKRTLKDKIDFRQINFMAPRYPINTLFEIIFCRNVIIYFEQDVRDTLLARFAKYLQKDNGFLFLGHSELINDIPTLQKHKMNIFQKTGL